MATHRRDDNVPDGYRPAVSDGELHFYSGSSLAGIGDENDNPTVDKEARAHHPIVGAGDCAIWGSRMAWKRVRPEYKGALSCC